MPREPLQCGSRAFVLENSSPTWEPKSAGRGAHAVGWGWRSLSLAAREYSIPVTHDRVPGTIVPIPYCEHSRTCTIIPLRPVAGSIKYGVLSDLFAGDAVSPCVTGSHAGICFPRSTPRPWVDTRCRWFCERRSGFSGDEDRLWFGNVLMG